MASVSKSVPLCELAISWPTRCLISARLALAESGRKSGESALGTSGAKRYSQKNEVS